MSRQNPFMRSTNDRYCNNCQNDCKNHQQCCDECDDCHDKDKNPCVVCPPGPAGPQGPAGDTGAQGPQGLPGGIINNKTYIPLRFLSEFLGYNVDWDADTRTANITTD